MYVFISNLTAVECSFMVKWVIRPILISGPLSYFSYQPVLHNWFNKGHDMDYHVCGVVHIKDPLLLIRKRSPCSGSSGCPLFNNMSDAI